MSSAALSLETLPVPRLEGSSLAQTRSWMADPLGFLESATAAHGDAFVGSVGGVDAWHFSRPDHVRRILVENAANYNKDTRGFRALRVSSGNGLVTSEGELWKRQRRIVNPGFRRESIASMGQAMVECTEDLRASWSTGGGARDVAHDMMELTFRIACRTFVSADLGSARGDAIAAAADAIVKQFLFHLAVPLPRPELLPTPGNLRFWRALRAMDKVVYALIAERRLEANPPPDLMSMLLAATDEETGQGMSDQQLRDELVTMLVAGHETTANGLAWTLHLLGENPEWQVRVREELDQVLGGRAPTAADVPKLERTLRVFFEAIRLYPPAWMFARRAVEADRIGEHEVAARSMVVVSPWLAHRDPGLWPDPLRFDPDRFLPEAVKARPKMAWFPFGGGSRKCIGDRFAPMEAVLILATLLQGTELVNDPSRPPVAEPGLTLRPRDGVWQDVRPLR